MYKNPYGALKSVLYTKLDNKPVEYGLEHENDAINDYKQFKEDAGQTVEVEKVGLILSRNRPGYGAKLDGRVYDNATKTFGGLECKCPISKAGMTVEEACIDRTFYLKKDNEGNITLKKNHNYHYQIQGQMYITGLKWTDFVVWFGDGNEFVQRINFDSEEWSKSCLPALDYFYEKAFVPELLTRRVKRGATLYESGQWIPYKKTVQPKD